MSNEKVRSYYNKKNGNVKRTREMTWNDAMLPPFLPLQNRRKMV